MKLYKYLFAILAVAGLAFASCSDDDGYDWAKISGEQVYFSSETDTIVEVSKEATSVTLPIYRVRTDGELTVPLTVSCGSNAYTIPTSVTFADSSSTADIVITYNPADIAYNDYAPISIAIGTDYATEYGISTFSGLIGVAEPWSDWQPYNEAGTATWTYEQFFSGDDTGLDFYVRQNQVTTNLCQFRIDNALYGVSIIFGYDESTGIVTLEPQNTGYYSSNYSEDVYVCDYNYYWSTIKGYELGTGFAPVYGSFDSETGIIEIPVVYYISRGYFGQGYETLTLDGFTRADYSASVIYKGKLIGADENTSIVGTVTLGADVASASVALVEGSLTQEGLNSILDGTYENMQTVTESGDVTFDASELADGTYTLVVVSYDAEGEAQEYDYVKFAYTASADKETWTACLVGDYVYTLFFGSDDEPYTDTGLTLYQSDRDETRFKIENWGYGVDFTFTMQADGSIVVDDQETGYTSSSYGAVMVDDLTDYTNSTDYGTSSYDASTGTFNFAIVYYVSAGAFGFGTETYTVTDEATKERLAKAVRAAKKKARPAVGQTHQPARDFRLQTQCRSILTL